MRVFISYSRRDIEVANRIAAELTSRGANVFIDYERLQAGENFPERLAFELEKSDAVVFLLSEHSAASKWVRAEIQLAFHHDKPIIPVALDNVEMPRAFFFLMHVERVDFTRWQGDNKVEAAIRRLVTALSFPDQTQASAVSAPNALSVWRLPLKYAEPVLVSDLLQQASQKIQTIIGSPFEWCYIPEGIVVLSDASRRMGTRGGKHEIPAYAIAKYPVTNEQYQRFVDVSDGYQDVLWWNYSPTGREWRLDHPTPHFIVYEGSKLPRTNISWYDAVAFCMWLSEKSKQKISLPTEQQWQRAAQGDDTRTYPWGNEQVNESLCNSERRRYRTTPVNRYINGASPYGVMDMTGNVWEWCLTSWETGQTNIGGDKDRVIRGGSFMEYAGNLHVTARNRLQPHIVKYDLGFRIALSINSFSN